MRQLSTIDELDKTTALKKAYAEIILNTAKESASRVMLSDRKSARFQHDLSGTKEEALRLLVRLKQMIDAKTIEADVTSSNQQRQIDVLEAQLQEAEDIITDLRSEVRLVRDKLEKAKAYESQERNVLNKVEERISVHKVDPEVVVESLNHNQEVSDTCIDSLPDRSSLHDVECEDEEKYFEGLSVNNTLKGNHFCESELDAHIRVKKLELSRNGCTQRIHALERSVLVRKSSSFANEEEQQGTAEKGSEENLSSGKVNGHEAVTLGNTRCIVLALRASSSEVITQPSNALGIKKTRKSRGRRKRRYGKRKATSVRSQSQFIKPCKSQAKLPCSKTSMEKSDGKDSMETHLSVESKEVDALNTCKGLEEHLQHKRTLYCGDISIIRKGKMSKNMHPNDHLVEACRESSLVSMNAADAEYKADIPKNETKIKPITRLNPGLTSVKSNVNPTSGSINVTVLSEKEANRPTDKGSTSRKEYLLVNCECEEDSLVPSTKIASNLVNLHSESKVTAVISDQISESPRANVNRLLKYTFQRKRKRGSANINNDSNNLPGKREENEAQDLIESTFE